MAKAGIPSDVLGLLAAADKRVGLPEGTMQSIMQQEAGGQVDRFLADPAAYHYAPNAQGQRIAPHTGKVSTAFGPLGILESTAADPGYGVAPLKDKSLPEQIRFAADYAAARGLANYGEGEKYAAQVAARVGKQGSVGAQKQVAAQPLPPTPTAVGDAGAAPDQPEAVAEAPAAAAAPSQLTMPAGDPWQEFRAKVAAARAPVQPQDLAYDQPQAVIPAALQLPAFNTAPIPLQRTDFRPFAALKRWTS